MHPRDFLEDTPVLPGSICATLHLPDVKDRLCLEFPKLEENSSMHMSKNRLKELRFPCLEISFSSLPDAHQRPAMLVHKKQSRWSPVSVMLL